MPVQLAGFPDRVAAAPVAQQGGEYETGPREPSPVLLAGGLAAVRDGVGRPCGGGREAELSQDLGPLAVEAGARLGGGLAFGGP
ncbi:hypothetical protein Pen01_74180 [Phytomonospora endophytica]|nr:hypothetical protein Pen01_74180 [Phytomonospora endophytica]